MTYVYDVNGINFKTLEYGIVTNENMGHCFMTHLLKQPVQQPGDVTPSVPHFKS